MKVAIIPDFCAENRRAYGQTVADCLRQYGVEVCVSQGDPEACIRGTELTIVLGGDGAMLRVAKLTAPLGKAMLGINCGHLGFMTGLEMDELALLSELPKGRFTVEERMMLSVQAEGAEELQALNEVAVTRGQTGHIAHLEVTCDGRPVAGYLADGLLIATPTGSTAYSLSAGGPVVDPAARCMVLTPLCPHSLEARPYVLHEQARLTVRVPSGRDRVFWSVDGEEPRSLSEGQRITVSRSDRTVRLIHLKPYSFYEVLHRKLIDRALY